MPDGLAAFLAERLDEAEAIARAASSDDAPGGDTWHQADPDRRPGLIRDQHGDVVVYDEGSPIEVQAEHIAANDPARTLRGITAKRAILAEHPVTGHGGHLMCDRCVNPYDPAGDELHRWVRYPCPTVRHLGSEWADHPAYLPEWSPEPATAPSHVSADPAGDDALKRSVATLEAQVALLMRTAQANGDVSVNAARETLGLPAASPEDP